MRLEVRTEGQEGPLGWLERRPDHSLRFSYAGDTGPLLSLSLPRREAPWEDADCRGYFANLLFEGPELERVLERHRLDRSDIGGLLAHLGADCPGAVSVTPEGSGRARMPGQFPRDYELLETARLEEILLSLHLHRRLPADAADPSPVAGVQGKLALLWHESAFYLPAPGSRAPTTHILKVSPREDPGLTRQEVALLQLAQRCGLRTAESRALVFDLRGHRIHAVLSTRFDREVLPGPGEGHLIRRRHAEDFCQALGLAPWLKYERNAEGQARRFSAAAVAGIAAAAPAPVVFLQDFLSQSLFNLLVGNSDNHAKNHSLLHESGGIRLSPLYDVVPVFMDDRVSHRLSFRHGEADFAEDLTRDNLSRFLQDLGYRRPPVPRVLKRLGEMAREIAAAAPGTGGKSLADALAAQAQVLERALDTGFQLPERDFYPRADRDAAVSRPGGWGSGG